MSKGVEAEADAIIAKLEQAKHKPCVVARHPRSALIEALVVRKLGDKAIEREMDALGEHVSDQSIRAHRLGSCLCRR